MLVSLKWLADYVALPLPAKALAERLTLAGAKVGRIIERGTDWGAISVGRGGARRPPPPPPPAAGAASLRPGSCRGPGAVLRGSGRGAVTALKPARIRG